MIFSFQTTSKGGNLNEILNSKPEYPLSALRSPLSALSLIAALFIPFNLQAEETGGFLGFTIGQMDFDIEVAEQFKRAGVSADERVLGWKFLGGYNFNEYFGAELAYVDAGEPAYKFANRTLGIASTNVLNFGLSGFTFAGVFRYPITPQLSIFAKGGGFIWSAKSEVPENVFTTVQSLAQILGLAVTIKKNAEDDGISYVAGAGAEFEIIENMSVRAEWERYAVDAKLSDGIFDYYYDDGVDFYSLGLLYKF